MARTKLRPEIEAIIPPRMRARPIDARGYCVPWFVEWIDGKPDFRVMDSRKWVLAVRHRLCWLCGEKLGKHLTFVIGPMCIINRVSSEPPSHLDCAAFAARACPFLARPGAQYRSANLPDDWREAPGIMLQHNPTACALWTCRSYSLIHLQNGYLVQLGAPDSVDFYHKGRRATRGEVLAAIDVGLPKLRESAEAEGADALAELERRYSAAIRLIPHDEPAEVRPMERAARKCAVNDPGPEDLTEFDA